MNSWPWASKGPWDLTASCLLDLFPFAHSAPTQVAFLLFQKKKTSPRLFQLFQFQSISLVFCLLRFALRLYTGHLTLHLHILTDVTSGSFLNSFIQNNLTACTVCQIAYITIWDYITSYISYDNIIYLMFISQLQCISQPVCGILLH